MIDHPGKQTPASAAGGPIPTLVVDDAGEWVTALREFLKEPTACADGFESHGREKNVRDWCHASGLALLDLKMPRANGCEVAGHLRVRFPGMIVVIASTYSEVGSDMACHERLSHALIATGGAIGLLLPIAMRLLPASARLGAAEAFEILRNDAPAVAFIEVALPQGDSLGASPNLGPDPYAPRIVFAASRALQLSLTSLVEQTADGASAGHYSWKLTWKTSTAAHQG